MRALIDTGAAAAYVQLRRIALGRLRTTASIYRVSDFWLDFQAVRPGQLNCVVVVRLSRLVAQSRNSGRVRVAELLLGMDGEKRASIADQVTRVLTLQKQQNRPRTVSCDGEVRLTICISQKGACQIGFADARDLAITVMTLHEEKDRLLLWLQYSEHEVKAS